MNGAGLIIVHHDLAGTRGVFISPEFCRRSVFPWYQRIFAAAHERGRKGLCMRDGDYSEVPDDLLALGPDGLYVESSSMDPGDPMRRAWRDKTYLIKTDSRIID